MAWVLTHLLPPHACKESWDSRSFLLLLCRRLLPTGITMRFQTMSAAAHDLYFLLAEANLLCCMQPWHAVIACSLCTQSLQAVVACSLCLDSLTLPCWALAWLCQPCIPFAHTSMGKASSTAELLSRPAYVPAMAMMCSTLAATCMLKLCTWQCVPLYLCEQNNG